MRRGRASTPTVLATVFLCGGVLLGVPDVPDLRKILDRRDAAIPTDDVPVLTDHYAPTTRWCRSSSEACD